MLLQEIQNNSQLVRPLVDWIREEYSTKSNVPDVIVFPKNRTSWLHPRDGADLESFNLLYRFTTRFPARAGTRCSDRIEAMNSLMESMLGKRASLRVSEENQQHYFSDWANFVTVEYARVEDRETLHVEVSGLFYNGENIWSNQFVCPRVFLAYSYRQNGETVTNYLLTDRYGRANGPLPKRIKRIKLRVMGTPIYD